MLTKNQKKIPPKATHKKPTAQLPARSVSFFSANKLLAILHADNKNESENFQSEGSASSPASFQTNPKEENQTRLNNLSSHENYSSPLSVQPVITSRIEVSQASSESNRENQTKHAAVESYPDQKAPKSNFSGNKIVQPPGGRSSISIFGPPVVNSGILSKQEQQQQMREVLFKQMQEKEEQRIIELQKLAEMEAKENARVARDLKLSVEQLPPDIVRSPAPRRKSSGLSTPALIASYAEHDIPQNDAVNKIRGGSALIPQRLRMLESNPFTADPAAREREKAERRLYELKILEEQILERKQRKEDELRRNKATEEQEERMYKPQKYNTNSCVKVSQFSPSSKTISPIKIPDAPLETPNNIFSSEQNDQVRILSEQVASLLQQQAEMMQQISYLSSNASMSVKPTERKSESDQFETSENRKSEQITKCQSDYYSKRKNKPIIIEESVDPLSIAGKARSKSRIHSASKPQKNIAKSISTPVEVIYKKSTPILKSEKISMVKSSSVAKNVPLKLQNNVNLRIDYSSENVKQGNPTEVSNRSEFIFPESPNAWGSPAYLFSQNHPHTRPLEQEDSKFSNASSFEDLDTGFEIPKSLSDKNLFHLENNLVNFKLKPRVSNPFSKK